MKVRSKKIFLLAIVLVISSMACQGSIPASNTTETNGQAESILESNNTNGELEESANTEMNLTIPIIISEQEISLIQVYENVNPGVVFIVVYNETGYSTGSGFVIDKQGHIVTNLHVVKGASEIQITFPSGILTRAKLIGEDANSDLAILKVNVPEEDLFPLTLGDSKMLQVGQLVAAIGNPFGLSGTMTTGIISGLGRSMESLNTTETSNFVSGDLIQTDAAINHGNSGGPLLNLNGEVIGVNRAIETFSSTKEDEPLKSGIGFAVSVNVLKRAIPDLIEKGSVDYPYLGISNIFNQIPLSFMEEYGLERSVGALVHAVTPNAPSDLAGILHGDLILQIEDHQVLTFSDLITYLFTNSYPGDVVDLIVLRGGEEIKLELEIGARP